MTPAGFPYIYRWDRRGRMGQFCRIEVRGHRTNSLLIQFEDGGRMVTSVNAIKRRPEYKFKRERPD